MSFLNYFISLLCLWRPYFCTEKLFERARALAIALVGNIGRKTLSNAAIFLGHLEKGYEADCAAFSRRKWNATELFDPLMKEALKFSSGPYISVAADDLILKKTGKKIKTASWRRDPLSPPFHVNFVWGLRFLQFSLLIDPSASLPSRAIPADWIEAPSLKKLKKSASEEEIKAYKKAKKEHNLSTIFVENAKKLKKRLVDMEENKDVLFNCDASFCNKICMGTPIPGVEISARCRKNAKLCFPYQGPSKRRKYAEKKFTPEEVRKDGNIPWKTMQGFYGGKMHEVKYKEVNHVLWQGGSKMRHLKLIVLAPTPYRKRKNGKLQYREPAYLLATAVEADTEILIQCYLNRWQIEVNNREEKAMLGVGQAQVTNENSVARQPAFHVAAYSALLIAARKTYGDKPIIDQNEPKWRKNPTRLTLRAMIGLLRWEIINHSEELESIGLKPVEIGILLKKVA
jgi:hypothetical protein